MRREKACFKGLLAGVVSLVVIGTGIFSGVCTPMEAGSGDGAVSAGEGLPGNPVYHEATGETTWDYVYFGSYPRSLLSREEITDEVRNAVYDENGNAVVDGVKLRRLNRRGANYSSRNVAEGFFDWKSVEDEFAYFRYEPIRWKVLQKEGEELLLLSDEILDCQRYVRHDGKVTWSTSDVRKWLNGSYPYNEEGWSFLTTAFSQEERRAVETSEVKGSKNPLHATGGGEDVTDQVFLPSVQDMTNEAYGFPRDYMIAAPSRRFVATDYARAMGLWMGSKNGLYDAYGVWMLRTPGSYQQTISLTYRFGHVYQDGYYANTPYYGVVPMLRVKTSAVAGQPLETFGEETLTRMNGAGISLKEVVQALEIALGIQSGEPEQLTHFDLDGNGRVELTEVVVLLEIALGIKEAPGETETPGPTMQPSSQPSLTPAPQRTAQPLPSQPAATEEPLVQRECEPSGRIWIAGDSIADYHSKNGYVQPLYGWGELLGSYFQDGATMRFDNSFSKDVANYKAKVEKGGFSSLVLNCALSSRSSKSFTSEPNYASMMELMGEGDYLLISFGHNDERGDVLLYTDPFGSSSDVNSFQWFLKHYYVDPAIRAGVCPVLISPVPRRYYLDGRLVNPQLHTAYGEAMQRLVEEYAKMGIKVYYVELHSYMLDRYEELGEAGTALLHGKYGNTMDNTHLSKAGATMVCERLTSQIREQKMGLAKFLKTEASEE